MLRLHRGNTGFVGCPGDSGGGVCAPCTEAVSSLQRGFRSKLWPLAARHPPSLIPVSCHTHMHKRKIHLPHPLISWPAAFIGAPDCCVPPHSLWLDSSGADWESAYINANTEKYTSGWSDHWRQCYFLLVLEKREEGGKRLQAKREGEGELTLSDTIRSSVTLLQPCLITCFTHWPRF